MSVQNDIALKSTNFVGGTLASDVLHRLREDIISCVLKPGDKLRFEGLREIYGASFSTLREALSCLAAERLVVAHGQRGFVVAPISGEDLLDVTDARVLIELECVTRAMQRGGDTWKAGLMSAFHKLDRIDTALEGQQRVSPDWEKAHFDFHEALVASAGSPTLRELRHSLFDRARRYRRISAMVRKVPRVKSDEHRIIMETVLSGEVAAARMLMEKHVREVAQNILNNGLIVPEPEVVA
jgi:GntR family carbon starvation induced transcriptional regulator